MEMQSGIAVVTGLSHGMMWPQAGTEPRSVVPRGQARSPEDDEPGLRPGSWPYTRAMPRRCGVTGQSRLPGPSDTPPANRRELRRIVVSPRWESQRVRDHSSLRDYGTFG